VIGQRYGGLSNLGEKLMKAEDFSLALDEITFLITLLANCAIERHNFLTPTEKKDLLTEEQVEILTTPLELASYREAITEAMFKGTARHIESEDDPKNAADG